MSHNEENVGRSARNHKPAIIAIIVVFVVVAIAIVVYAPWKDRTFNEDQAGDVAEGINPAEVTPPVSPEGAAPTPANN